MTETEEKTKFKFSELSDTAKDTARDKHRYTAVEDDWWDNVYEDAVRMAALLGIRISATSHQTAKGRVYQTTDISFSGFWSQGDGACFEGQYQFRADAVEQVTQETNDEELLRIANELTLLQVTRRVLGLEYVGANITSSTRSNTIDVELDAWDEDRDDDNEVYAEAEDTVAGLMRNFADWIYKQLEQEYDWLHSNECVDERLADDSFDEDGCMI